MQSMLYWFIYLWLAPLLVSSIIEVMVAMSKVDTIPVHIRAAGIARKIIAICVQEESIVLRTKECIAMSVQWEHIHY